jgi:hypothetical protein
MQQLLLPRLCVTTHLSAGFTDTGKNERIAELTSIEPFTCRAMHPCQLIIVSIVLSPYTQKSCISWHQSGVLTAP